VNTQFSILRRYLPLAIATLLLATLVAGWSETRGQKSGARRMAQVTDWSARHVLYSQTESWRARAAIQRDPRAYWSYTRMAHAAPAREGHGDMMIRVRPVSPKKTVPTRPDWSVSLGAGGTAKNMYPAKYSFDVNATPDCTNDYAVFAINAVPGSGQANIAAFNNLYSGTTGGTGVCGSGSATPYWAYQVSTVALPTSPILSLDGTKVAFVDGDNPAVFHVLTWTANQGTVTAPATPTGAQIVDVTLTGATTDTNSSPFMDYVDDAVYVGTDNGLLFKITGVFNGTPALAGAPWPLTVGAGGFVLSSPVYDFGTGNLFVGGADGNLYGFTSAGAAITGSPLQVGSGAAFGGIVDGPIDDVVNGLLYVTTGENAGASSAVLVQTGTSSFSTVETAGIGTNGVVNIHSGVFNAAYFSESTNMIGTTSEWFFYVCGVETIGLKAPELYRVGFNASRVMNATVNGYDQGLSSQNNVECSPLSELMNGVDRLFLGLPTTSPVVESFDISTSISPTATVSSAIVPGGTSAIIVDNVSAEAQASSIYFSTLAGGPGTLPCGTGNFCAVKLTQGGLQ
jgi:hypothetical protein